MIMTDQQVNRRLVKAFKRFFNQNQAIQVLCQINKDLEFTIGELKSEIEELKYKLIQNDTTQRIH